MCVCASSRKLIEGNIQTEILWQKTLWGHLIDSKSLWKNLRGPLLGIIPSKWSTCIFSRPRNGVSGWGFQIYTLNKVCVTFQTLENFQTHLCKPRFGDLRVGDPCSWKTTWRLAGHLCQKQSTLAFWVFASPFKKQKCRYAPMCCKLCAVCTVFWHEWCGSCGQQIQAIAQRA